LTKNSSNHNYFVADLVSPCNYVESPGCWNETEIIMQDNKKNWRNFSFKKQKTDNNCDWKQQQPCDKKATSRIIFVLSY
jgi:hypothetical protein